MTLGWGAEALEHLAQALKDNPTPTQRRLAAQAILKAVDTDTRIPGPPNSPRSRRAPRHTHATPAAHHVPLAAPNENSELPADPAHLGDPTDLVNHPALADAGHASQPPARTLAHPDHAQSGLRSQTVIAAPEPLAAPTAPPAPPAHPDHPAPPTAVPIQPRLTPAFHLTNRAGLSPPSLAYVAGPDPPPRSSSHGNPARHPINHRAPAMQPETNAQRH